MTTYAAAEIDTIVYHHVVGEQTGEERRSDSK
jgi:hypothetical protein